MAFALAFLAALPAAWARPEVQSAFLSFGRSRAVTAHSWGVLSYRLLNPDPTATTVRLRLLPEDGGAAVFEFEAAIGPGRFLEGREMVTVATSDKYRLELYQGDTRIASESVLSSYADPLHQCQIFFLDDDPEFAGAGELARLAELPERVRQTKVGAARAPGHWAGYDHSRIVAVGTPDFRQFDSHRFAALIEYVNRGGTLVFLAPAGTLAAADTPLADLLPVTPLHVRLVEELPELDAWAAPGRAPGAPAFASPDGIPFLESVPRGAGVTTLAHGDFPVVRWRSVGLGRVGVVAVSPGSDLARDSGCFLAVWTHLLAWGQAPYSLSYRENNTRVPALMAQLTGHRIPEAGSIALLLFGYAALIAALLVIGYARRRHTAVWTAAAALGLLATAGIFLAAHRQHRGQPRHSATLLAFATAGEDRAALQAVVGLQSRGDSRPTLAARAPDTLIRNLPTVTRGMRKQTTEAPVLVHRARDLAAAPHFEIRALKPRSLAVEATLSPRTAPPLPLHFGADGPALAPAPLPDWLPAAPRNAFVILPNGLFRARLAGGQVQELLPLDRSLRLDPFQNQLADLLGSGRFPAPALALVHPWSGTENPLDLGNFAQQGYTVQFLPLQATAAAGPLALPPECIRLEPHDGGTRAYLMNPDFSVVRHAEHFLGFDAYLPPWLHGLEPAALDITVNAANPGGNLVTEVRLVPAARRGEIPDKPIQANTPHPLWRDAIAPAAARGDTFRFANLPPDLFDPVAGRCHLLVRVSQKTLVRDPTVAERANSWRFGSIRMHLTGNLPEQRDF